MFQYRKTVNVNSYRETRLRGWGIQACEEKQENSPTMFQYCFHKHCLALKGSSLSAPILRRAPASEAKNLWT